MILSSTQQKNWKQFLKVKNSFKYPNKINKNERNLKIMYFKDYSVRSSLSHTKKWKEVKFGQSRTYALQNTTLEKTQTFNNPYTLKILTLSHSFLSPTFTQNSSLLFLKNYFNPNLSFDTQKDLLW